MLPSATTLALLLSLFMQTFNIIITGVGGQGLITLLQLIAQTALDAGFDVKTSELHGLSQRGGSVIAHIRFGKKACPVRRNDSFCLTGVFSPMVALGKADLVLALETQEALAGAEFASDKTVFLINEYQTPTLGDTISKEQVAKNLQKISKNFQFIPAAGICQKEFGKDVTAGVFLLGIASEYKMIPLSADLFVKTIKKIMPEKYWDLNIKTIELASKFEDY